MKRTFQIEVTAALWEEDGIYIAEDSKLPIASFGKTRDEAIARLLTSISKYMEVVGSLGELASVLEGYGVSKKPVQREQVFTVQIPITDGDDEVV